MRTLGDTFLGLLLSWWENVLGWQVLGRRGPKLARGSEGYLLYEGRLFSLTHWIPQVHALTFRETIWETDFLDLLQVDRNLQFWIIRGLLLILPCFLVHLCYLPQFLDERWLLARSQIILFGLNVCLIIAKQRFLLCHELLNRFAIFICSYPVISPHCVVHLIKIAQVVDFDILTLPLCVFL